MGHTTSSLVNKLARPVNWIWGRQGQNNAQQTDHSRGPSPFVYTRQGSMFFDEDGDLAHEFYEEIKIGNRLTMKRKRHNLKPQGEIELSHPRLHMDIPVVMCEALVTAR